MPTVKNVGEPCAGEPHARFEVAAGGNQTSRAQTAARSRRLPPTLQVQGKVERVGPGGAKSPSVRPSLLVARQGRTRRPWRGPERPSRPRNHPPHPAPAQTAQAETGRPTQRPECAGRCPGSGCLRTCVSVPSGFGSPAGAAVGRPGRLPQGPLMAPPARSAQRLLCRPGGGPGPASPGYALRRKRFHLLRTRGPPAPSSLVQTRGPSHLGVSPTRRRPQRPQPKAPRPAANRKREGGSGAAAAGGMRRQRADRPKRGDPYTAPT
jgi:hypothetical protein